MAEDNLKQISEAEYEANKNSWQYKCVQATRAHQSKLGAILCSALGKNRGHLPQFQGFATITSDGSVMCNFVDRHGVMHLGALVCDVQDLVRNFRGLADHCKLPDADRIELFKTVRQWITKDYRAKSELF